MAKNNKAKGTKRERDVVKLLSNDGWVCQRTPGSLGTMDVVALRAGDIPRYIQVKATAKPFSGFPPLERYDLLADAQKAGARAELCWWPDFGKPTYIQPEKWPPTIQPKPLTSESGEGYTPGNE